MGVDFSGVTESGPVEGNERIRQLISNQLWRQQSSHTPESRVRMGNLSWCGVWEWPVLVLWWLALAGLLRQA
jgi:hypothetical protein